MSNNDNSQRRFFTEAERRSAFIAAGGVCQMCGKPLGPDFHADHVHPFVAGGKTAMENLQALCPECNLAKGAGYAVNLMPTPPGREPREWQQSAFEIVMRPRLKTTLIQATPGAGKTGLACGVARAMMASGRINRVLVVSPLTTLQEDWARAMSAIGLEIDPDSTGRMGEAKDYQGRSLTYAALSFAEGRHGGAHVEQMIQHRTRTLVILDEIHHASDKAAWGIGLRHACAQAEFVLCLSGTPFRTDGGQIPFVTYDQEGNAKADFTYSYASAIADQVCRPVFFPAYEGQLEWLSGDEIYRASFADELDPQQESKRLRSALMSDGWVTKQLADAHQRLMEIRATHFNAGGLVVAMDQTHARYLAEMLERVCFATPVLVLSDDADADERLQAFREGSAPWVIAVRKVSEGVDVPRLRVCVYMSNVITEMFFRQVVGRAVRYTPGIQNQEAFVYIPSDRRLIEMAARIQEERIASACLLDEDDDDGEDEAGAQTARDLIEYAAFQSFDGIGWHEATITYNGDTFTHHEIEAAKPLAVQYGIRPEIMARMVRDGLIKTANGVDHNAETQEPLFVRKRKLRGSRKIQALQSEIRWRFLGHITEDKDAWRHLNAAINRALGTRSGTQKTEEQYQRQVEILEAALGSKEVPAWLR